MNLSIFEWRLKFVAVLGCNLYFFGMRTNLLGSWFLLSFFPSDASPSKSESVRQPGGFLHQINPGLLSFFPLLPSFSFLLQQKGGGWLQCEKKEESFHWLLELMSLFLATNLLPLLRDSPFKSNRKVPFTQRRWLPLNCLPIHLTLIWMEIKEPRGRRTYSNGESFYAKVFYHSRFQIKLTQE